MRAYPYLLPLSLLLVLPACPGGKCDEGANCSEVTESTGTTDATGSTTGSTGSTGSTTDEPTGSGTESPPGTTTDVPVTTGSTTDTTTGSTTDDPSTTTGDPPLVGDPASYGQACAPDDGPATEFKIQLAERLCDSDWPEDVPLFRITIFEGIPQAQGDYVLDPGWGFVYYDTGDGNPLGAKSGTLSITELTADGLRGTYDIILADDTPLVGEFDAIYCPVDVLCG